MKKIFSQCIQCIKLIIFFIIPSLFIFLISLFKINSFIEGINNNIKEEWLGTILIEIYMFLGLILFISVVIFVLNIVSLLLYEKSFMDLIKELVLDFSFDTTDLKLKLEKNGDEKKLNNVMAFLYLDLNICNLILIGYLLYQSFGIRVEEIIFELNIQIEKLDEFFIEAFDKSMIMASIIIFFTIIYFVILLYCFFYINKIFHSFFKNINIILKYFFIGIGLILVTKKTNIVLLFLSFCLIFFFVPIKKGNYLILLDYISALFRLYSEVLINNIKKIYKEIIKFLSINFLLLNFVYFFIKDSNFEIKTINIISYYIFSFLLTVMLTMYLKKNKIERNLLIFISSIFILTINFFSLKIFEKNIKFEIKEITILIVTCFIFFEKIGKFIKEIGIFIRENDIIFIYNNYSTEQVKKEIKPLDELENLTEKEIEKQFIFYIKLTNRRKEIEKILNYYEEKNFKNNFEFIYYLYLKNASKKSKKYKEIKEKYEKILKNKEKNYESIYGKI